MGLGCACILLILHVLRLACVQREKELEEMRKEFEKMREEQAEQYRERMKERIQRLREEAERRRHRYEEVFGEEVCAGWMDGRVIMYSACGYGDVELRGG